MPRGHFELRSIDDPQNPTEISGWIVVDGEKIGKIIINTLNSRSGEAFNLKVVFYEDEY